jgi:hypothetical protein
VQCVLVAGSKCRACLVPPHCRTSSHTHASPPPSLASSLPNGVILMWGLCLCVECVVLCWPGTCRQLLRSHGTFVAKCFLPDDAASTRGSGLTSVTHSVCDDAVRAHEVWVRVEEAWESSSLYIHAKALFERVVTPAKSLFLLQKKMWRVRVLCSCRRCRRC